METRTVERCKHGLKKVFCGICCAPEGKPKVRRASPESGRTYVVDKNERFFVISNREHLDRLGLMPKATHVHFAGFPSLVVVRKILEKFPDIRILNFSPCLARHLEASLPNYTAALAYKGVKLQFERVTGIIASTVEDRRTDPRWLALRSRYFHLRDEDKRKLQELESLGFEEATVFKWYLLLEEYRDEERISMLDVAQLLGNSTGSSGSISIRSVMCYLDGKGSDIEKEMARGLANRAEKRRKERSS